MENIIQATRRTLYPNSVYLAADELKLNIEYYMNADWRIQ